MKAIILGVVGIGGVGTAGYYGFGPSGPDDFIRTTAKAPQAVYAAFDRLGQTGETIVPSSNGKRIVQRVTKVPNQQVKLELLVDETAVVTAEVQLTPDGTGTRIAAELDVDTSAINEAAGVPGGGGIPQFAFQDYLVDQVFARAMGEVVDRIEQGKPLLSLAATRARWDHGGDRPRTSGASSVRPQSVRPQLDARPTLDPNAAARRHMSGRPGGSDY